MEKNLEKQMYELQNESHIGTRTDRHPYFYRAGLKFAYQDRNKQREVEEAKLKQSNPNKAEQLDRLGMGYGNRR